jgi:hypothetical protein
MAAILGFEKAPHPSTMVSKTSLEACATNEKRVRSKMTDYSFSF